MQHGEFGSLSAKPTSALTSAGRDQYRRLYDALADHRGGVAVEELDHLFANLGLFSTREELEAIISEMDIDQSATLGFDDFCAIMHRLNGEQHRLGGRTMSFITGLAGPVPNPVHNLQRFRVMVWNIMEDPSFSPLARTIAMTIMFLIFVSIVNYIAESVHEYASAAEFFSVTEALCITVFTAEYVVRFITCPAKWPFLKGPLNVIDLVSILPFYFELISKVEGSTAVLRIFRLVRVTRIFKISRYVSWIKLISWAVLNSLAPLGMAIFITLISTIILGSAMYYIERGDFDPVSRMYYSADGTPSDFQDIPVACWWCIITMTTVGYGDVLPTTPQGKTLACITSLCGIVLLAIPISVFSANFSRQYSILLKRRALQAEQTQDLTAQVNKGLPRHLKTFRSFGSAALISPESQTPLMLKASAFAASSLEHNAELHQAIRVVILSARKRLWYQARQLERRYREKLCVSIAGRWAKWFDADEEALHKTASMYLDIKAKAAGEQRRDTGAGAAGVHGARGMAKDSFYEVQSKDLRVLGSQTNMEVELDTHTRGSHLPGQAPHMEAVREDEGADRDGADAHADSPGRIASAAAREDGSDMSASGAGGARDHRPDPAVADAARDALAGGGALPVGGRAPPALDGDIDSKEAGGPVPTDSKQVAPATQALSAGQLSSSQASGAPWKANASSARALPPLHGTPGSASPLDRPALGSLPAGAAATTAALR